MNITAIILAAGIPSAFTGFCIWWLQKKLSESEKRREQQADERQRMMLNILKSVNATMGLSEATATAVQRIPDAHCNGDMHQALEYVKEVKHEQREFFNTLGIKNLYDN